LFVPGNSFAKKDQPGFFILFSIKQTGFHHPKMDPACLASFFPLQLVDDNSGSVAGIDPSHSCSIIDIC
jgi:hypothetical protein